MKKIFYALTVLLIALLVVSCVGSSANYFVTVNGEPITKDEYDLRYKKMTVEYRAEGRKINSKELSDKVLDSLVNDKIIVQAAREKDINIPIEKAEQRLAKVKSKFKTTQEWQALLKSRHLTEEDMVEYYHHQMIADALKNILGGEEQFDNYIKELRSKAKIE